MTQEEKQLLLKDLCARLPYAFVVHRYSDNVDIKINSVDDFGHFLEYSEGEEFKPYLRPMSSMTDEERNEFDKVLKSCNNKVFACPDNKRRYNFFDAEQEDFMNAHHFDYRGLIPMGLALEALEGMYKNK